MKKNRISIFMMCIFSIFCLTGVNLLASDFSNTQVASASSPMASVWDGDSSTEADCVEGDYEKVVLDSSSYTANVYYTYNSTSQTYSLASGSFSSSTTYYAKQCYINSAAGLAYFASQVNAVNTSSGARSYAGYIVRLTTDIDLAGYSFTAIGNSDKPFSGIFDGQGHTIYNLSASANGSYTALFGYSTCIIKNLSLSAVNFSGSTDYTAALVAYNTGTISSCSVRGVISASGQYVGAIAAYTTGNIEKCANFASITSDNSSTYTGGIVGYASGATISQCFNEGGVSAKSGYAGGIVGCATGVTVENSYNSGEVKGGLNNGGVVGWQAGALVLSFCYNCGTVSKGSATNSAARGLLGGMSDYSLSLTIYNCLELTSTDLPYPSGATNAAVDGLVYASSSDDLSTLKTLAKTAQFYNADAYSKYFSDSWCSSIWTFSTSAYPQLDILNVSADGDTTSSTFLGSGTASDPYLIYTVGDLSLLASLAASYPETYLASNVYYTLMNDLDLTGLTWTPIGSSGKSSLNAFQGVFDGNNHTISGLTTSMQYEYGYYGLFAGTSGAVIKNLTVENPAYISQAASGTNYSGILVGVVSGTTYFVNVKCKSVNLKFTGSTTVTMYAIGGVTNGTVYVIYGKNNLVSTTSGSTTIDSTTFATSSATSVSTGYDVSVDANGGQIYSATISSDKITKTSIFAYGEYHIVVGSDGSILPVKSYQSTLPEDVYKYKRDNGSFIGSIVIDKETCGSDSAFDNYLDNSNNSWQMSGSTSAPTLKGSVTLSDTTATTLISYGLTASWTSVYPVIVTVYNAYDLMQFGKGSHYSAYSTSITTGYSDWTDITASCFTYSTDDKNVTLAGMSGSLDLDTIYYDTSSGLLFKVNYYDYSTAFNAPTSANLTMRKAYTFTQNDVYLSYNSSDLTTTFVGYYGTKNNGSYYTEAVKNLMMYVKWQASSTVTIAVQISAASGFSFNVFDSIKSITATGSSNRTYEAISVTNAGTTYTYTFNVSVEDFLSASSSWKLEIVTNEGYYLSTGTLTGTHDTNFGKWTLTDSVTAGSYSGYSRKTHNTYSATLKNLCGYESGGLYTLSLTVAKYLQNEDSITLSGGYLGFGARQAITISNDGGTYSTNVTIGGVSLESILGDDAQSILRGLYSYQSGNHQVYLAFDFLNGKILFSSDSLDATSYDAIGISNLSSGDVIEVVIGSHIYYYTITAVNATKTTATITLTGKTSAESTEPYILKVTISNSAYSNMSYYAVNDFVFIGEVINDYAAVEYANYFVTDTNTNAINAYNGSTVTRTDLVLTLFSDSDQKVTQKALFDFSNLVSVTANTLTFAAQPNVVVFVFKFVDENGNEVSGPSISDGDLYRRFTVSSTSVTPLNDPIYISNSTAYSVTGAIYDTVYFQAASGTAVTTSELTRTSVVSGYSYSNKKFTLTANKGLEAGVYTICFVCQDTQYALKFYSRFITYGTYVSSGGDAKTIYSALKLESGKVGTVTVNAKATEGTTEAVLGSLLSSSTLDISAGDTPEGYNFLGYIIADTENNNYGFISSADFSNDFTYEGLFYAATGTSTLSMLVSAGTNSYSLYGVWSTAVTEVTFDKNDSSGVGSASANYATAYISYGETSFFSDASLSSDSAIDSSDLVPTRDGYTFGGWYAGSTRVLWASGAFAQNVSGYTSDNSTPKWRYVGSSLTLTALWTANGYTLTYNANGGSVSQTSDSFTIEDSLNLLVPTQTGYTFTGWKVTSAAGNWTTDTTYAYDESTGTWSLGGTEFSSLSEMWGNVTLTAQWTEHTYTISFDYNSTAASGDVTEMADVTVTYSQIADDEIVCTLTKTGYVFNGWMFGDAYATQVTSKSAISSPGLYYVEDSDGNKTYYAMGLTADDNGSVTLKATWALDPTPFTVYAYMMTTSGTYETTNTALITSTKYNGIYGQTITFHAENGSVLFEVATNADTDEQGVITKITETTTYTFSLEGFTFDDGTTDLGTYSSYVSGITYYTCTLEDGGATKIYLYFSRNQYALTVDSDSTVSSITASGTGVSGSSGSYTVYYGADVTLNITMANGYEFTSITETSSTKTTLSVSSTASTASSASSATASFAMPSGALNLKIASTPTVYTITYNTSGGVMNGDGISAVTSSYVYQSTYTIETATFSLAEAGKNGYTFAGWFSTSDFQSGTQVSSVTLGSTGDVVLYAKWTLNTYTITFETSSATLSGTGISGGEGTYTLSYTIEDDIALPEPKLDGYDFLSWEVTKLDDGNWSGSYEASSQLSGMWGNVTLTAAFDVQGYILTLTQDDAEKTGSTTAKVTYASSSVLFSSNGSTYLAVMTKPSITGYTFEGWTFTYGGVDVLIEATGLLRSGVSLFYYGSTYVGYKYVESGTTTYLNADGTTASQADFSSYTEVVYTDDSGCWVLMQDNVELFASWSANQYYIAYSASEGSFNTALEDVTATYDQVAELTDGLAVDASLQLYLARTGYVFATWALLVGDELVSATEIFKDASGYYYTSTSSHLTTIEAVIKSVGSGLYVYTDAASGESEYYALNLNTSLNGTTTIYAVWSVISTTLTINLNDTEGSTRAQFDLTEISIEYSASTFTSNGSAVAAADLVPTRDGYEFSGFWLGSLDAGQNLTLTTCIIDANGNLVAGVENYSTSNGTWLWIDGDFEIYALWTACQYTVTLDQSSATTDGSTSITVTFDTTTSVSFVQPEKTGYTFIGWFSDVEDSTSAEKIVDADGTLQDSTAYTTDGIWTYVVPSTGLMLYAHFDPNTDTKFVIRFVLQGSHGNFNDLDASYEEVTYYGTSDTEILIEQTGDGVEINGEEKTFEGFTFFGYTNDLSTATTAISYSIAADGSTTFSLYFSRISYTLTLTADDGVDSVTFTDEYATSYDVTENSGTFTMSVFYGEVVKISVVYATGYDCTTDNLTAETEITMDKTATRSKDVSTLTAQFNMPSDDLSLTATSSFFVTAVKLSQEDAVTRGTTSATISYFATSMAYDGSSFVAPKRTAYEFAGYWTSSNGGATLDSMLINADGLLCTNVSGYTDSAWLCLDSSITLYAAWTLISNLGEITNSLTTRTIVYDGEEHTISIFDYLTSSCDYVSIDGGFVTVDGVSVDFSITCDNSDGSINAGNITVREVGSYNYVLLINLYDNAGTRIEYWRSTFTITVSKAEVTAISAGEATKVENVKLLMSSFVPDSVTYSGETLTLSEITTFADLAKFAKGMNGEDSDLASATDSEAYLFLLTKYYLVLTTTSGSDLTYRNWTYSDYETYAESNSSTITTLSSATYIFSYALDTSTGDVELAGSTGDTFEVSDLTIYGMGDEEYSATKVTISGSNLSVGNVVNMYVYVTDSNFIDTYRTVSGTDESGDEVYYVVSYSSVLVVPYVLTQENMTEKTFTFFDSAESGYSVDFVSENGSTQKIGSYQCQYVMEYGSGAIYVYVDLQTSAGGSATESTQFAFRNVENFIYANSARFFYYVSADSYQDLTSRLKFALSDDFIFTILRIDNVISFNMDSLYHTISGGTQTLTSVSQEDFTDPGLTVSQITYYDTVTKTQKTIDVSASGSNAEISYSFSDDGKIFYVERYSSSELEILEQLGQQAYSLVSITFSVQNSSISTYVSLYKWAVDEFTETGVDGTSDTKGSFTLFVTDSKYDATTESVLETEIYAVYTDLVLLTFDLSNLESVELSTSNNVTSQVIKLGVSTIKDVVFPTLNGLELENCVLSINRLIDILTQSGQSAFFTGTGGVYVGYSSSNLHASMTFECTWGLCAIETSQFETSLSYAVASLTSFTIDDFASILNINESLYSYSYAWTSLGGSDTSNVETDGGTLSFTDGGTTNNNGDYTLTITATLNSTYAASLGISAPAVSTSLTINLQFMARRISAISYWETSSQYDASEKLYSWTVYVQYYSFDNENQQYTEFSNTYLTYVTVGDITFEAYDSTGAQVSTMVVPDTYQILMILADGKFELSDDFVTVDNSGTDEVYFITYDLAGRVSGEEGEDDDVFEFVSGQTYYVWSDSDSAYVQVEDSEIASGPVTGTYYFTQSSTYVGYLTTSGKFVGAFSFQLTKNVVNLDDYYPIILTKTFNTDDPDLEFELYVTDGTPTLMLRREEGEDVGSYNLYLAENDQNAYYSYYADDYLICDEGELVEGYYYIGLGGYDFSAFETGVTYYTYDSTEDEYTPVADGETLQTDVAYYVYGVLAEYVSVGHFTITANTTLRLEFADCSNVSLKYLAGGYTISLAFDNSTLWMKFTDQNGNSQSYELKMYEVSSSSYITKGSEIYNIILAAMQESYTDDYDGTVYDAIVPLLYLSGTSSSTAVTSGTYSIGFEVNSLSNYYTRVDMLSTNTLTITATEIDVSALNFTKVYDGTVDGTFDLSTISTDYANLSISVTYSTPHVGEGISVTLTLLYNGSESDENLANYVLSSQVSTGTITELKNVTLDFELSQSTFVYGDVDYNNLAALVKLSSVTLTYAKGTSEEKDVTSLLSTGYYDLVVNIITSGGYELTTSSYNISGYVYVGSYLADLSGSKFSDFEIDNLSTANIQFEIGVYEATISVISDFVVLTTNDAVASYYPGSVTISKTSDTFTVNYVVSYQSSDVRASSGGDYLKANTYDLVLQDSTATYANGSITLVLETGNGACRVVEADVALYATITDSTGVLSQTYTGSPFELSYETSSQTITLTSYECVGTLESFDDGKTYYIYQNDAYTQVSQLQETGTLYYVAKSSGTMSVTFGYYANDTDTTLTTLTDVTFTSISFAFSTVAKNVGSYYVTISASGASALSGAKTFTQVFLKTNTLLTVSAKEIATSDFSVSVVYGSRTATITDISEVAYGDDVYVLATFTDGSVGTGKEVNLALNGDQKSNYKLSSTTLGNGVITKAEAKIYLAQSEFTYGQLTLSNYDSYLYVLATSNGQSVSDAEFYPSMTVSGKVTAASESAARFINAGTYTLSVYARSSSYTISTDADEEDSGNYIYNFTVTISPYEFSLSNEVVTIPYGTDISEGVEFSTMTYFGETVTFKLVSSDASTDIGTYTIKDASYTDTTSNYILDVSSFTLEIVASNTALYLLYENDAGEAVNAVSFTYDGNAYTSISIVYEEVKDSVYSAYLVLTAGDVTKKFALKLYTYESGEYTEFTGTLTNLSGTLSCASTIQNAGTYTLTKPSITCDSNSVNVGYYATTFFYVTVEKASVTFLENSASGEITDSVFSHVFTSKEATYSYLASSLLSGIVSADSGSLQVTITLTTDAKGQSVATNVATGLYVFATLSDNYAFETEDNILLTTSGAKLWGQITKASITFNATSQTYTYGTMTADTINSTYLPYSFTSSESDLSAYLAKLSVTPYVTYGSTSTSGCLKAGTYAITIGFSDSNVEISKYVIDGGELSEMNDEWTLTISQKTVDILGSVTKTYDGTNTANVSGLSIDQDDIVGSDKVSISSDATFTGVTAGTWQVNITLTDSDAENYTFLSVYGTIETTTLKITFNYNDEESGAVTVEENRGSSLLSELTYPFTDTQTLSNNATSGAFPTDFVSGSYVGHSFTHWTLNLDVPTQDEKDFLDALEDSLRLTIDKDTSGVYKITVGNDAKTLSLLQALAEEKSLFGYYHQNNKAFEFVANWEYADYEVSVHISDGSYKAINGTVASVQVFVDGSQVGSTSSSSSTTTLTWQSTSIKYTSEVQIKVTTAGEYASFVGLFSYRSGYNQLDNPTATQNQDGTTTYTYTIDSIATNYVLYFAFSLQNATITFNSNGATVSDTNGFTDNGDGTYTLESDYFTIASMTFADLPTLILPTGKQLSGYVVGGTTITDYTTTLEDYISSLSVSIEASLTNKTYQITLYLSENSQTTISVEFGYAFNTADGWLDSPSIGEEYQFNGWFTGINGTGTQISGSDPLTADSEEEIITILYADWNVETFTVTVTFANATLSNVKVGGFTFDSSNISIGATSATISNVEYGSTLTFTIVADEGYVISTSTTGVTYENNVASVSVTSALSITFTATSRDNVVTLSGEHVASVVVTGGAQTSWTASGSAIVWDSSNFFTTKTDVAVTIVARAATGYVFSTDGLESLGCSITNVDGTLTLIFTSISTDLNIEFVTTERSNAMTIEIDDVAKFSSIKVTIDGASNTYSTANKNLEQTLNVAVLSGSVAVLTFTAADGYEICDFDSDYTYVSNIASGEVTKELVLTIADIYEDVSVTVSAQIETFDVTLIVLTYDDSNEKVRTTSNAATISFDQTTESTTSWNLNGITLTSISSGTVVSLSAATEAPETYSFTGWMIDGAAKSGDEIQYTISSDVTIYAIFSSSQYSGVLRTYEKITYPDGNETMQEISGGVFADESGQSVTSFKVFYGAYVAYTFTIADGYYLKEIGYYDDSGMYNVLHDPDGKAYAFGDGYYDSSIELTISGSEFVGNSDEITLVAVLAAYNMTISVSTIITIDGYTVENSNVGTVELVDENGNSVGSDGYVDASNSRVQLVSTTTQGKEFSVQVFTGDVIYLKVNLSRDGYAIEDLTLTGLDGATYSIFATGTNYVIFQIQNLVASGQTSTHEIVAAFRPKLNAFNLRMSQDGNLVDAGGFVVADASGTEYQMVWSSSNFLSSVQASAYTDGVISVVAYIRVGYEYAGISDSAAIVSGVKYEELSVSQTGFTGKVTFTISGYTSSSTIYVLVTPQTYTVVLKNEDETLAKISNVAYGSVLDLSEDNSGNITIYSKNVYFSGGVLTFSISDTDHTFRGFFTEENGSGTQYIDSDGVVLAAWAEKGYTFDTITNTYILSDNVENVEGVLEVSLYAYETYLKTIITISVTPTMNSSLKIGDVIEGTDETNSWTNSSTSIEVAFNTDIRFVAPEISGYSFYRFVISQKKSDGTYLADVTSYSSTVPWSTSKSEDIIEVVVSLEYFAQITVNVYGGYADYTITQSNSDSQATALLDRGYVDTTKSFTITAEPADGYLFDHWYVLSNGSSTTRTSLTLTATRAIELDLYVYGKSVSLSFASDQYVTTYGLIHRMSVTDVDGDVTSQSLGFYGTTASGTVYQKTTLSTSVKVGDTVTFYVITDEGFGVTWNRNDITYEGYENGYYLFSLEILANMANGTIDIIPTFSADKLSFYVIFSLDETIEEASDSNNVALAGYVEVDGVSVTTFSSERANDVVFQIVTSQRYGVASVTIENYGITYDGLEEFLSGSTMTISKEYISENDIKGVVQMSIVFTRLMWENIQTSLFEGSGTSSDPYLISTAEELALMLNLCNSGAVNDSGVEYRKCSFILQDNVDLSAQYWTPIGTTEFAFDGTFNFNGHAVSSIYFTQVIDGTSYSGLFGVLGENAKIITSTTSIWWAYLTGGLGGGLAAFFVIFAVVNSRRKKRHEALRVK